MATRTHIILPDDILSELDQVVGHRRRSEFVTEAVREKLLRLRQIRALQQTFGILKDADTPEWETPKRTSAWVREMRSRDSERLEQLLERWSGD